MRLMILTVPALVALSFALRAGQGQIKTVQGSERTACHGTTVDFVDTPAAAAKLAAKQKKLVFVLHVSGHFEDPNFT